MLLLRLAHYFRFCRLADIDECYLLRSFVHWSGGRLCITRRNMNFAGENLVIIEKRIGR